MTLEGLKRVDSRSDESEKKGRGVSRGEALKRNLARLDAKHVKSLFASPKLAWSTSLLIVIWGECSSPFRLLSANLENYSFDWTGVPVVSLRDAALDLESLTEAIHAHRYNAFVTY